MSGNHRSEAQLVDELNKMRDHISQLESELREVQRALLECREQFKSIFDDVSVGVAMVDREGYVVAANEADCQFLGYSEEELLGMHFAEFTHPDDLDIDQDLYASLVRGERDSYLIDKRYIRKRGEVVWGRLSVSLIRDEAGQPQYTTVVCTDITENKQTEKSLQVALKEKEVLLQELYHRTKNNMAVICGFLNLQASFEEDGHLRMVLSDMERRIKSMALVHEKLYQARDLSRVNLGEYVSAVAHFLMGSYGPLANQIDLVLDVEEVPVLIDTATPCGLLLNELLTNAFQHAFPEDQAGEIRIQLYQVADTEEIVLQVSDNGVGVPDGFDFSQEGTLGLRTVFALGERQLRGTVMFEANHGVACEVRFRDNLYTPRV